MRTSSTRYTSPGGAMPGLAVANAYTLIGVGYCGSFCLLYYFVVANNFLAAVHLLALLSVLINYVILKRTGNYERTDIIMTIGTVVVICMFASGGWEKTGFLWPFAFLPFVFFLTEPGKSVYWVTGLIAGCAASAALQYSGIIDKPYSGIALLNFFACLTVFMACNYFVKQKAMNYKEVLDDTRNLLNASIDPFFTIGRDGTIKDVNNITEKITGVPYRNLLGSGFATHFVDPDSADRMCDEVFTKGIVVNFPLTIRRHDTAPVELMFNAVLYRDEKGKFQSVFAIGRDITERIRLEKQLRQFNESLEDQVRIKTRQLAQKATELEQFAYFASHDLQEPLNTTAGFIRLLKKKYEGKLDKETDVYFSFITQASERMKTLIRVLLEYSRLGGKKELVRVDCNALLREVLADLGATIQTHAAVVKVDALPEINGYSMEMKLLFQNLLSNAIKFGKKDCAPEIHISTERGPDHWTFCVADNGIGIEPGYHDKIFLLFRRLHTRAEYEGTGIGLAHCRKIVELHDGKIWVESEPGMGSRFYFTIHDM